MPQHGDQFKGVVHKTLQKAQLPQITVITPFKVIQGVLAVF